MVDIAPELYKEIQRRFQEKYDKAQLFGNPISDMRKKLDAGTATFQDADLFAVEIGSMLSESMIEVLQLDQLPNKQLYYNIAQRTIGPSLQETYGLVSSVAAEVQEELNAAAGIGIRAMTPKVNEDRIHGLVDKAVEAPDQAVLNKILQSPVENLMMSAVDDTVKANAELQSKAGLQPIIRRVVLSKCCDWCSALAGTYRYPDDVPDDVYKRHQNCRCTVEYIGAGKRQDVWSKKKFDSQRDERIARTKEIEKENEIYNKQSPYEKIAHFAAQESSKVSIPPFMEGNFDDCHPLNISENDRAVFTRIYNEVDKSGFEYGEIITSKKTIPCYSTSDHHVVMDTSTIDERGLKLYHGHTNDTLPSEQDLSRFIHDEKVDVIGVVTKNQDVFVVTIGDGYIPDRKEFEQITRNARTVAERNVIEQYNLDTLSEKQIEYLIIREKNIEIIRQLGWRIEGGKL